MKAWIVATAVLAGMTATTASANVYFDSTEWATAVGFHTETLHPTLSYDTGYPVWYMDDGSTMSGLSELYIISPWLTTDESPYATLSFSGSTAAGFLLSSLDTPSGVPYSMMLTFSSGEHVSLSLTGGSPVFVGWTGKSASSASWVHIENSTRDYGMGQFEVGSFVTSGVPEPDSWVMLLAGTAAIGAILRRRRKQPRSLPVLG